MEGWSKDAQPYKWAKMGKPLTPAEREQAEVEKLAEYIVVTVDTATVASEPWFSIDALAGQCIATD